MKKYLPILPILIFLLAVFFRLYGVSWDQNQHLHPDERFLTMVTQGISWPQNLFEYFNTTTSSLNPHNRGFGFFVYGTFPLLFTKIIAQAIGKGDYTNLTLIGRQLSALADLGTVILVYAISKTLIGQFAFLTSKKNPNYKSKLGQLENRLIVFFPLVAMFLYSSMVLPIQLSHFYAVDTYLTFFLTLTFFFLVKLITSNLKAVNFRYLIINVLTGISFGLAMASKISALLFSPIIILSLFISLLKHKKIFLLFVSFSLILISSYFTLRLYQPYLFQNPNLFDITLNQKVLDNWKQLKSFDDPTAGFPPGVQWIKTKPFIFPLKNMVFWGLGLPLGVISILAVFYSIFRIKYLVLIKRRISLFSTSCYQILILILLWTLALFFYQGMQFAKTLRYFYPIYPFLAVISALFLNKLFTAIFYKFRQRQLNSFYYLFFVVCFLFFVLVYPFSFVTIYSRPNTRIAASLWIYKNIPAGSTKSTEHWDDALPLSINNKIHEVYTSIEYPLYHYDTIEKWEEVSEKLKKTDYIFLTSNRLYGSIMTMPEKWPITYRYYQSLFDGSLGFEKIAEFTSRPNIPLPFIKLCLTPPFVHYGTVAQKSQECPLPGISFVDDYADEMFTVYDHPKVIIFKKVKQVDYFNILQISNIPKKRV